MHMDVTLIMKKAIATVFMVRSLIWPLVHYVTIPKNCKNF